MPTASASNAEPADSTYLPLAAFGFTEVCAAAFAPATPLDTVDTPVGSIPAEDVAADDEGAGAKPNAANICAEE